MRSAQITKIFEKRSVFPSTQNALKRIEMGEKKKKKPCPITRQARAVKRNLTYPMSPSGSQGVFMPSFMPIGQKLWALDLEGYTRTDRQTEGQSCFNYIDCKDRTRVSFRKGLSTEKRIGFELGCSVRKCERTF